MNISKIGKRWKWLVLVAVLIVVVAVLSGGVGIEPKTRDGGAPKIGIGQRVITIGNIAYAAGTADYTCDGVADDVQFQAALNSLPAGGGQLVVLAGNYNFTATVTRAIANVSVVGTGQATYIANDGGTPLFTAGGNNWKFMDLELDAGSINMGATTEWMWTNVDDGTFYAYRSPYGQSVLNDLTVASVTDGGLTSGRVPVAGIGGLLGDDADLTFAGSTTTATNLDVLTNLGVGDIDITDSGADDRLLIDTYAIPRTMTYTVAASDAPAHVKAQADAVCTGMGDMALINTYSTTDVTIKLTQGTYNWETPLLVYSNETLIGDSLAATIIKQPNNTDQSGAMICNVNLAVAQDYTVIRNLQLDGNQANQGAGEFDGIAGHGSYWYIDNVYVKNTRGVGSNGYGICFWNGSNSYNTITNCTIENCERDGICFRDDVQNNYNMMSNISIIRNIDHTYAHQTEGFCLSGDYNSISHCLVNGSGIATDQNFGVSSTGYYTLVDHSVFQNLIGEGYYDHTGYSVVTNNVFHTSTGGVAYNVVEAYSQFSNNRVYNYETAGIIAKDNCVVDGNIITYSTVVSPDRMSVGIGIYGSGVTVVGNVIIAAQVSNIKVNTNALTGIVIADNIVDKGVKNGTGIDLNSNPNVTCVGNNLINVSADRRIANVVAGSIVRDNYGYVTENSGTATIVDDTTSIKVTHGLVAEPTRVQITLTSSLGNATEIYVSDKDIDADGSKFQVDIDADLDGNVTFDWRAVVGEGN